MTARKIIANVVVLTPPAVPTGEPPVNIKNSVTITEGVVSPFCGIVTNPAVRVVTDWKQAASIFCPIVKLPIVSGLWYSNAKYKTAPAISKNAVITSTILECSFNCSKIRRFPLSFRSFFFITSKRSNHTIKPRPLIIISDMVTTLIQRSCT